MIQSNEELSWGTEDFIHCALTGFVFWGVLGIAPFSLVGALAYLPVEHFSRKRLDPYGHHDYDLMNYPTPDILEHWKLEFESRRKRWEKNKTAPQPEPQQKEKQIELTLAEKREIIKAIREEEKQRAEEEKKRKAAEQQKTLEK